MYDLDDNPLANGSISVESAGFADLQIKADCRAGYVLRAKSAVDDLSIEGKHAGAGAFTNLETGSIDLSPWNGSREIFDIRLTGETVTARTLRAVVLSVEIA